MLFSISAHADGGVITVGYNRNLRPLQYVDEGGSYVGMHIDMLDWMAA
jgi:hypothetical protein